MKIAIVRREWMDTPDGINIFVYSLCEELLQRGHQVTVVGGAAFERQKIEEFFQMRAYPALRSLGLSQDSGRMTRLLGWKRRGQAIIEELEPDFVIENGALPFRTRFSTCRVSHDCEREGRGASSARVVYKMYVYRNCDYIVATCSELQTGLSQEIKVDPKRISIIPTCVRLDAYENQSLRNRELAILHMGTIGYKNPLGTLRAFAQIKNEGARCYITGKRTRELEDFAASLPSSVRKRIEFVGFVSAERLRELLGCVRLLSVPSVYFTPVASPTAIEGLASGTPMVCSPSISRDVLVDQVNGYVCPPGDSQGLASRMNELLEDDETWLRMSVNASKAAENFSSARVADKYLALSGAN